MDWICIDGFQIGKDHFLALADRSSGMCWGKKLKNLTANSVKDILDNFSSTYAGPPHKLTSDGGSNLTSSVIEKWCEENNISHEISSAGCPESNGESESAVKRAKHAIQKTHYQGKQNWEEALKEINQCQRANGSGSPAEIFFKRPTRVGPLPIIPQTTCNLKKKKEARQTLRSTQLPDAKRAPDAFTEGEEVVIRSEKSSRWNVPCTVQTKRSHGNMVRSYVLINNNTGKHISRNERYIRHLTRLVIQNGKRHFTSLPWFQAPDTSGPRQLTDPERTQLSSPDLERKPLPDLGTDPPSGRKQASSFTGRPPGHVTFSQPRPGDRSQKTAT